MCIRSDSMNSNTGSDETETALAKKKRVASKKLQAAKFKKAPGAPR